MHSHSSFLEFVILGSFNSIQAISLLVRLYVEIIYALSERVEHPRKGVQAMVYLFYITYISVDLANNEIFRAEVGKGS